MKNVFGRIGKLEVLNQQIREVRKMGGKIIRDRAAGTVRAEMGGEMAFRALDKGQGIWLIIYNGEFYAKPI